MTAIELRQMRTAARMSQAELADAANVPRIYIASIERGADFIPQIEAALRSALVQRQREMQEALL